MRLPAAGRARRPRTRRRDRRIVRHGFEITGGAHAPRDARMAVQAAVGDRLDPTASHDLRLLVSEVVTNSVRHGGAGPSRAVTLTVTLFPSAVRVEVAGPHGGFDPPPAALDPAGTSGRGLTLLGLLSTRWGVGLGPPGTVWFEMSPRRRS